jgi:hypothetical protein
VIDPSHRKTSTIVSFWNSHWKQQKDLRLLFFPEKKRRERELLQYWFKFCTLRLRIRWAMIDSVHNFFFPRSFLYQRILHDRLKQAISLLVRSSQQNMIMSVTSCAEDATDRIDCSFRLQTEASGRHGAYNMDRRGATGGPTQWESRWLRPRALWLCSQFSRRPVFALLSYHSGKACDNHVRIME